MKQKNLILMSSVMFVLVVLTLSVVSAGFFTGKAINYSTKIYTGNERTIPGTKDKIKIVSANDNSAIVSVNGEIIEVLKGRTENFNGYSVYVSDIGKLFRKYWARVQVKELSGSSAGSSSGGSSSGTSSSNSYSGENKEGSDEPNYCRLIDEEIKNKVSLILEEFTLYGRPHYGYIFLSSAGPASKDDYFLIPGKSGEGIILKVSQVTNVRTGYSNDEVKFTNVLTGKIYQTVITQDGSGTLSIEGKNYHIRYGGIESAYDNWVSLNREGGIASTNYNLCNFAKITPKESIYFRENGEEKLINFNRENYSIKLDSLSNEEYIIIRMTPRPWDTKDKDILSIYIKK
jgi:hypothetical protein